MMRCLVFLSFIGVLSGSLTSWAQVPAASSTLPAPIADILKRANVPESSAALVVRELGAVRPLVQHNSAKGLNPASVMKLLTSGAALDLLGPAFTYKTDFLVKGSVANGVLDGDLHIKAGGDPKLTYERLWMALRQLRERGIREIRGDIIIDRSYFAPVEHDPARFDGKPLRAYNVGPDAFLVNFKAVTLRFIPEGDGVRIVTDPAIASLDVLSRVQLTKNGSCGDWQERLKLDVREDDLLATVHVEGKFPESCGERAWPVSVFDHQRYVRALLHTLWSEAGGRLLGVIREGPVPPDARRVLQIESPALSDLIRDINKYSNNTMARQVFLSLSSERDLAPGTASRSALLIRNWLGSLEIDAPELVIENGSGLSRVDRLSAGSTAALLDALWRRGTMPELISSLSLMGHDGTFKKRVVIDGLSAHLKSGTLNDVRATAGFVLDRKGRRWVVVMYIQHGNAPAASGTQEALLNWLSERP
jgi:serine-type D-Ala-D-Ala carboxypeptidase/endopeptidase (penicillin-binding protein 4)